MSTVLDNPAPIKLSPYKGHRPPKVWDITVIVPINRRADIKNVLINFKRQEFAGKRLLVVENGEAVGACASIGLEPDTLLQSEENVSVARNTALDHIRKNGGGFVSMWDSDDYYGPGYLDEVAGLVGTAEVIGKSRHFVKYDNLLYLFLWKLPGRFVQWANGPTLSFQADEIPHYPIQDGAAEEVVWQKYITTRGGKIYNSSIYHHCYYRVSDASHKHLWKITLKQMVTLTGTPVFIGMPDYDLINGLKHLTKTISPTRKDPACPLYC